MTIPTGEYIRSDCQSHNIDVCQLHITKEAPTSYTDVMTVKSTGRRTFFHQRGANALSRRRLTLISPRATRASSTSVICLLLDRLDQSDPVNAEASRHQCSKRAQERRVQDQRGRGERGKRPRLPTLSCRRCASADYCILERIGGRADNRQLPSSRKVSLISRRSDVAARQLVDAGVREWVVIHFPYGAIAVELSPNNHCAASVNMPQASIGGTTGAGDTFAAGILLGLHENAPMQDRLCATESAPTAASLTNPSSSDGVVPLRECLEFGRKASATAI